MEHKVCICCGHGLENERVLRIDGDDWCAFCADELDAETKQHDRYNRDDEICR